MTEPAWEVRADTDEGVLYIDLEGDFDGEAFDEARERVVEAAETFDGPFGIINDISGVTLTTPDRTEPIERGQEQLEELGVADVVRVVDDDTGEMAKLAFGAGATQVDYDSGFATSIEEARERLDI